jgi:putative phosphoribosyl transferase
LISTLAETYLPSVTVPTLIVGRHDESVIEMNQAAYDLLTCGKKLVLVPGATHLFEEPGTLEQVAEHASKWFRRYL